MGTKLVIGYAGSLAYYGGDQKKESWFKRYFWTYNHIQTDSTTRSPYYLFLAVSELKKRQIITPDNFKMLFWGAIDKRNILLAKKLGIEEFLKVHGHKSKTETKDILATCSLLFLPLESSSLGEPLFIPGKLFEYISIGKPILALCETNSDAGQLLEKSGLALMTSPRDIFAIVHCIEKLLKEPSALESKAVNKELLNELSWLTMTRKISNVFEEL